MAFLCSDQTPIFFAGQPDLQTCASYFSTVQNVRLQTWILCLLNEEIKIQCNNTSKDEKHIHVIYFYTEYNATLLSKKADFVPYYVLFYCLGFSKTAVDTKIFNKACFVLKLFIYFFHMPYLNLLNKISQ